MARSLSQDSKTVTMPPRHIYNYKRGHPLVGRLLGTNAKPCSTAMAYRRFRPNRRFRNSGASRLRRSSYRRRNFRASRRSFAYRRRYRGRGRRNMGAARVRRLAARKKSDHSVGAVSDLMPLNSNVVLSGPENVFVLYCPSYLPRQQAPKEIARRDHLRSSRMFLQGCEGGGVLVCV